MNVGDAIREELDRALGALPTRTPQAERSKLVIEAAAADISANLSLIEFERHRLARVDAARVAREREAKQAAEAKAERVARIERKGSRK